MNEKQHLFQEFINPFIKPNKNILLHFTVNEHHEPA